VNSYGAHTGYFHQLIVASNVGSIQSAFYLNPLGIIGTGDAVPTLNMRDRIATLSNVRVAGKSELKSDGSVWVNNTQVLDSTGRYLGQIYASQIVPEAITFTDLLSLDMSPSPALPMAPAADARLYGTSALEFSLFGFSIS
jgi:hypothetical protein